jgi:3-hydroxy-D-aspartate aldolase
MENWPEITNLNAYDTPLFVVYEARIKSNIKIALDMLSGNVDRFRPHVKTHKIGEIIQLFSDYGISKIKCATIAEAELAAANGMADVLIAYQPVGFKINRLMELIAAFPKCSFSCLVDNLGTAHQIAALAMEHQLEIAVYADLNTGMNRTGFPVAGDVIAFCLALSRIKGLKLQGLHAYDGHLHDLDPAVRAEKAKPALEKVFGDADELAKLGLTDLKIVAGGSNTFAYYASQDRVECSPGTFVFWDDNYTRHLPELQFQPAALLICTVISLPADDLICVDLGYKSVSSENPLDKRVLFPWTADLAPYGHSEEHLTLKHNESIKYQVGDHIYGMPYHVCPTCALYEEAYVVREKQIETSWKIKARDKKISI